MKKTGVLLVNLGTPDAPEPEAVGRYLKQFLMDKWVIDIPWPLRWILVHLLIVPTRKHRAAEAYKQIWTEKGSPLLLNLIGLCNALRPILPEFRVEIAMRYGNPSVASGFKKLLESGVEDLIIFPLYPQYAESSTRSSQEECRRVAKALHFKGKLRFVPAFYDHPEFIGAYAKILASAPLAPTTGQQSRQMSNHLLLSFHGLPERHIRATDHSKGKHCLVQANCCDQICEANRDCYRAQSFATARALAEALSLDPAGWSVSFQSRLGRTPWIKPYTDFVIAELPKKGIKSLAVACPSFAADCLETLEEIALREKSKFLDAGGEVFAALPCPNFHPLWVDAVAKIVREFAVNVFEKRVKL